MKTTPLHNAISNLRIAATTALEKLPLIAELDAMYASMPTREKMIELINLVKEIEGADTAMAIIRGNADHRVKLADVPDHDLNRVTHQAKDCLIGSLRSAHAEANEIHCAKVVGLETTISRKEETIRSVTQMKLDAQKERDQANVAVENLSLKLVDARRDLDTLRNQIHLDHRAVQRGGVTDYMRQMVFAEMRERLALADGDEARVGPQAILEELNAIAPAPTCSVPTNEIPEYKGTDPEQGADDIRHAPMDLDTISLTGGQIETLEDRSGSAPPLDFHLGRMWTVKRENGLHLCWYISGPETSLSALGLGVRMKSASRRILEVSEDDIDDSI